MRLSDFVIPISVLAVAAAAACTATPAADGDTQALSSRAAGDPPGNNGTVKIEEEGSTDEIPENDPHVGCKFEIEFRGYDQGDLTATWSLMGQPPSGHGEVVASGSVFIGGDPAGGANDLDGVVHVDLSQVDLSGLTEQPEQGFHLKLEVHAPGSIGADTKFKVFWVSGCMPQSSSSGGSSSGGSSSGGSSSGGAPDAGKSW